MTLTKKVTSKVQTLPPTFEPMTMERDVRRFWDAIKVNDLVRMSLRRKKPLGYVEGPPTMNGGPHIGHIRGRVYKDLWYRFSTLRKQNVIFRAGWDTQGLPVELQAEKELGLTGSKSENLKQIGLEGLVAACKNVVQNYYRIWREADGLLGMSLDYANAYWTFKDHYIEREWKYLQHAWRRGLLEEGYRVVAYCPSCQTSLSHAEVGLGYEQVEDPSLYFKMKLKQEDAYLILWTTMPFTIVTDELVAVKPDAEYAYVTTGDEKWIVCAERVEPLMSELGISKYKVGRIVKGTELQGKKYQHPLEESIVGQAELGDSYDVHSVVAEDFVDVTTGSGLVHLSPANGEQDFEVATRRKVPIFAPIDDQARFTREAGVFEGLFVRDADQKVAELLKQKGALLRLDEIRHEYPTCWRSGHKLIWLARREFFYWVDRLGDLAINAAEKVEYFYEVAGERFLDIIKEKVPWCISRERVWGSPLPIWVCTNCSEKIAVFSRSEILERALELPDGPNFELHRPWIDRVVLKCPKCGGPAKREPFVLDTWHNSGASPYASFTDSEFSEVVPVEFLTEGIDQTRGWAYTLLILNVILTGKATSPYKGFLFHGHVLDEKGRSMHKSLGNVIDGLQTLQQNSADVLRFYLAWKRAPVDNISLSFAEMKARPYQVLSTLYHLHVYFQQNSNFDKFDAAKHDLDWARRSGFITNTDSWLLSKLQGLVQDVTEAYTTCRFHDGLKMIESFVIESMSQVYVPMTRSEIWDDSPKSMNRRHAIYATLDHTLKTIDILLHPVTPHITELLYQRVFPKEATSAKTILLQRWPKVQRRFKRLQLESEMELIGRLVSLANAARMNVKLKRRWPLRKAFYLLNAQEARSARKHLRLLREQLNVEEVVLSSDPSKVPVNISIRPRAETLGPKLRGQMAELEAKLTKMNPSQILTQLRRGREVTVLLGARTLKLGKQDLLVNFSSDVKHSVVEQEGKVVSLYLERDERLIAQGLVRDLARRMQALRKERGYSPTEILGAAYASELDADQIRTLNKRRKDLAFLVRVKHVRLMKEAEKGVKWQDSELDGRPIKISVE